MSVPSLASGSNSAPNVACGNQPMQQHKRGVTNSTSSGVHAVDSAAAQLRCAPPAHNIRASVPQGPPKRPQGDGDGYRDSIPGADRPAWSCCPAAVPPLARKRASQQTQHLRVDTPHPSACLCPVTSSSDSVSHNAPFAPARLNRMPWPPTQHKCTIMSQPCARYDIL